MRRIYSWTGTAVLSLAALMWATAPINAAQRGDGHGGDGRAGGGHAVARTGSVRYGTRAAPARVGVDVRVGAVRSEHYAGSVIRGTYRNPYRDDYFRRFRPGYRPIVLGDAQYYIYDSLPPACPAIVVNGIVHYLCDGVYYQPYIYGGLTVYMVVPPP